LEELNQRIADANIRVPMNRFRPNVVVSGAEPFAEDEWAKLKIGETIFRVPKPCARCVTTTVDQSRGEFDGSEPLKTLATFRRPRDVFPNTFESYGFQGNEVLFATNLIPENPGGVIRIGDDLIERQIFSR
jgi:uncharacterized protein YcbX